MRANRRLSMVLLIVCSGCGSERGGDFLETHEAVLYSTSLIAEGSCEWLACCSSYSVQYPVGTAGTYVCPNYADYNARKRTAACDPNGRHDSTTTAWAPSFACGGVRLSCDSSNQIWLSGPSAYAACNSQWVLCYQGRQVTASILDHADQYQLWEGSYALLSALGVASGTTVRIYSAGDPGIAGDPACGATCTPTTCAALGATCGNPPDGCGHTLNCGSCSPSPPWTCNASFNCQCTSGFICPGCGAYTDECGVGHQCGCPGAGDVCVNGQCCTPQGCPAGSCGAQSDGCGGTLDCGPCCTATGCGPWDCDWIPDGCGGWEYCGACCSPSGCGDFDCGEVWDGCEWIYCDNCWFDRPPTAPKQSMHELLEVTPPARRSIF